MRGAHGLEDKCYARQYRLIKATYGKEAAEKANYGWGVIDGEVLLDISTKVYGHGILRTVANRCNGQIAHEWC